MVLAKEGAFSAHLIRGVQLEPLPIEAKESGARIQFPDNATLSIGTERGTTIRHEKDGLAQEACYRGNEQVEYTIESVVNHRPSFLAKSRGISRPGVAELA